MKADKVQSQCFNDTDHKGETRKDIPLGLLSLPPPPPSRYILGFALKIKRIHEEIFETRIIGLADLLILAKLLPKCESR